MQCNAKIQYSNGQRCQREAMPGKSKCKSHGSGGVRTAAQSKGMGDTRADRLEYQQVALELYMLAKLVGITWIGRPPKIVSQAQTRHA